MSARSSLDVGVRGGGAGTLDADRATTPHGRYANASFGGTPPLRGNVSRKNALIFSTESHPGGSFSGRGGGAQCGELSSNAFTTHTGRLSVPRDRSAITNPGRSSGRCFAGSAERLCLKCTLADVTGGCPSRRTRSNRATLYPLFPTTR